MGLMVGVEVAAVGTAVPVVALNGSLVALEAAISTQTLRRAAVSAAKSRPVPPQRPVGCFPANAVAVGGRENA